jgi:hypothetical protein
MEAEGSSETTVVIHTNKSIESKKNTLILIFPAVGT